MWSDLPAHVVILIFTFLQDPESRLCALSACRRWRDIILSTVIQKTNKEAGTTVWQHQHGQSEHIDNPSTCDYIPRNDALVFKWCMCKTGAMVELVIHLLAQEIEYLTVKQIHMKGHLSMNSTSKALDIMKHKKEKKNNTLAYVDYCTHNSVKEPQLRRRKTEAVLLLLKRCTGLEVLDLGFDPDLSNDTQILQESMDKIKKGKLHILNIAAICETYPTLDNMCGTLRHMNMLTSLCLKFDEHFRYLVDVLSSGYNTETRLKQLTVVVSASFECKGVTTEMWTSVRRHYREMKVKLVVVYTLYQNNCTVCDRIPDLPLDMTVDNLVLMSNKTGPIYDKIYDLLISRLNKTTIEEISLHFVQHRPIIKDCQTHLDSIVKLRSMCKNLTKLELCGFFIDYRFLKRWGASLGRGLHDFIVYERDLLRMDVELAPSDWFHSTRPQLLEFEAAMRVVLGRRDWCILRTKHMNRSLHEDDRPLIERTLHEICNVIQ